MIEQVKILLDLLDSHDVIKKAYKDAYSIRRSQVIEAINEAQFLQNRIAELEAWIDDCPYCAIRQEELEEEEDAQNEAIERENVL